VIDIRSGCLGDPQAVEGQQGDQGVLGGLAESGGDQERADLVAVQGGGLRLYHAASGAHIIRFRACQTRIRPQARGGRFERHAFRNEAWAAEIAFR